MVITGFTRSTMRHALAAASLCCLCALTLTACGGGSEGAAASPATTVVTITQTVAPSTDASASLSPISESTSEPSDVVSTDSVDEVSAEPTGPPVIRNVTAPRKLTLADIFDHRLWDEGVYQIPRSTTGQQAMGVKIDGCNKRSMEVRLAEPTGKASVTVAQALDSTDSDVILQFKLLANGRLVDTKTVRFNQSATLTAALTGVSALTLEVARAPASQSCGATAVVTDFSVTPA